MGHTDVVPVNPDGLVARPVRRRADRRRGVGRGRDRHAQHHRVDGGRVPAAGADRLAAEGHADLLRRRRRGGRRALGRRVDVRAPLGRDRQRLRAHRDGRLVDRSATTACAGSTVNTGEKGIAWRRLRVTGHARPRLDAVRRRQRADQGRRGRAPPRRVPAGGADQRHVDGQVAAMRCPTRSRPGCSIPARIWATIERLAAAGGPHVPRLTHTTFSPERRPRRAEDEHHPRRHRARGRHPHRAGHHAAPTWRRSSHEALGELAHARRGQPDPGARPRPSRRPGNPLWDALAAATQVAYPGAELMPGLIVGGTDARFFREGAPSPTAPGCSRRRSAGDVRHPVPRQRRAHRHRVARPRHRLLDPHRRTSPHVIRLANRT